MRLSTGLTRGVWLAIVVSAIACAEPPHKEIDQAQGAIDAARAAGAERYAPTELTAANQALKHANDAVTARDYRLALNYALESREEAQNAARNAAASRAKLRGNVERSIAEARAAIDTTLARLDGPAGAQVPRNTRRTVQQRLKQLEGDLQKVDAPLQAEDYAQAERLLKGITQRIESATASLPPALSSQSPPRRK